MSSFSATIEEAESKINWSKCVCALSTLAEQLKFVISSDQISISAINAAHTSHGEIIFNKRFFKNYIFDPKRIQGKGLEQNIDDEYTYSFFIRSRVISMLFKKMEEDVESFKLSFNASDSCKIFDKYRLQVEVKTKSLIRKQFSPLYQPCNNERLNVSKLYKETLFKVLENQNNMTTEDEEINYIMINSSVMRNFCDTAGSSSEDLKLEVNGSTFSVTAFTVGVYVKEREVLKQPMAINIAFNVDELLQLKLYDEIDKKMIFRLRDFKTFLNLSSNNDYFETWFKTPGDPILFELDKNDITIQFVQVTDGENSHHLESKNIRIMKKSNLKSQSSTLLNEPCKQPTLEGAEKENLQPLFVPEDYDHGFNVDPKNDEALSIAHRTNSLQSKIPDSMHQPLPRISDDSDTRSDLDLDSRKSSETITWDFARQTESRISSLISASKNDERRIINEAKIKYLQEIKKRKTNKSNSDNGDELGPTQDVTIVKGLFD